MTTPRSGVLMVCLCLGSLGALVRPTHAGISEQAAMPQTLTVAVVQQAREPELTANRDKIIDFVARASQQGCKLVIFPEDALGSPPGTTDAALTQAVEAIGEAARTHQVYVVFCAAFPIAGLAPDKRGQALWAYGPDGRLLQRYNKLICNLPKGDPRRAPGLFEVDGLPCAAMICADRWLRGCEELPVTLGAKLLIDCSANARSEWIPEFGWYLPVTRALRNGVYTIVCNMGQHPAGLDEPRHGHSAIVNPDGTLVASADDTGDQMLVATLDLAKADAAAARRRHGHPVFQPFWDQGRSILQGQPANAAHLAALDSPGGAITIAAAQMACSRDVTTNLESMTRLVREAAAHPADVVVFPELAVTGALAEDVKRPDPEVLVTVLKRLRAVAAEARIAVVFGMPYVVDGRCWNSAWAVGPDGALLTRYDQMVVDRPELFEAGGSPGTMWFRVKGIPAIVTIGGEALWNEIGELAACRGAELLFNLDSDPDVTEAGALRQTQRWVQLASFQTFSATVNAAAPDGLARPGSPAGGGSAIWDDFGGHRKQPGPEVEVYSQYSACRVVSAGQTEQLLYAQRTVPKSNAYLSRFVGSRYPHFTPWYEHGAAILAGAP